MQIGLVSGTSCIGCTDGVIRFTTTGAITPLTFSVSPPAGIFSVDSLTNLPPGTYLICVTDSDACAACDTATVLEDPSKINTSDLQRLELNIFPNPAKGSVSISYKNTNSEIPKIRILDLLGKEIPTTITGIHRAKEITVINLSLENIRSGNYLIELILNTTSHFEKINIREE
ncbi:MAG: T9SS type A sorting domain-containing protein [Bacteroidetes bacterium]|nr:T9SS type A sorting domain-containing protein [Bacteroidota bacterium]